MIRPTHPKKEIEEALRHAEGQGWRIEVGGSHAWGAGLLPVQRGGVPLWRVLHHLDVEHAEEPWQPCASIATRRGQLHCASQSARG